MSEQPATADDIGGQVEGVLSRSAVLIGSKAGTWALAFVMTVLLPRYLGAAGFGQLYFAISFTVMASMVVEFGLNSLVTREVARRHDEATQYLVNGALIKSGLWVAAAVVIAIVLHAGRYPAPTRAAVGILTVGLLVTSVGSLVTAVLQAADRARWIATSAIVEKAAYVVLGGGAVLLGFGVVAVASAVLAAAVVKLVLDLWWLLRLSREEHLHSGWRGLEVRALFRRAVPFFSILLLGAIYFRVDVLILSLVKGDAVVGWYGAAYRLFETTNLLPEAIMFAFFPVLARFAKRDIESLTAAAQKNVDLLLLFGVPIATGIFVLAGRIIAVLYGLGQYANSVTVLRVLAIAIALMYANGAFVYLLIATERQHRLVVTAGVAAALNVTLNLVLIPMLGGLGGAITTVLTEVVVVAMNFSFLPRDLIQRLRYASAGRIALSAGAMGVALFALSPLPLLVVVLGGTGVYLAALRLFRALPAEDWAMMRRSLVKMRAA